MLLPPFIQHILFWLAYMWGSTRSTFHSCKKKINTRKNSYHQELLTDLIHWKNLKTEDTIHPKNRATFAKLSSCTSYNVDKDPLNLDNVPSYKEMFTSDDMQWSIPFTSLTQNFLVMRPVLMYAEMFPLMWPPQLHHWKMQLLK